MKEGAGGLRDYHVVVLGDAGDAAERARPRATSCTWGCSRRRSSPSTPPALDFLWRVRNELHLLAGRKNDQMSFELQEQIAASLRLRGGATPTPSCRSSAS